MATIAAGGVRKTQLVIDKFRGVDLHNSPANVDDSRSPEAPNMIRDVPGKVRKRMGYYTVNTYESRINGRHLLRTVSDGNHELIHAGTSLYKDGNEIRTGMKDDRSQSWQIGGKLYIIDGKEMLVYGKFEDAYTVKAVSEAAYVPTIVISRNPDGGGESYEPINLMGDRQTDSFLGKASVAEYQLSLSGLTGDVVTAEKMLPGGEWQAMAEGTDFTVDRETGTVTFTEAPGASPLTGEDNVHISYSVDRSEGRKKINSCDISMLFGLSGMADRIFVSGNPELPHYDWWCQQNDPSYFGDIWYSVLGQDSSKIVGYAIISDRLAAFKDHAEDGRNIILRSGTLSENNAAFPIVATLQGEGAVCKHGFATLSSEPIFVTALGFYAITPADITGEKYSQNRSFYLNRDLLDEDLKSGFAVKYKDFYIFAVGDRAYIMDSLQKAYEKGAPYSNYQYECYYWEGISARVMWEDDGVLCFGRNDGKVCRFYTDVDNVGSYSDDGEPVKAYWDIPDMSGKRFYENKTVRYFAARLSAAPMTGMNLWGQVRGIWKLLKEDQRKARYFTFSNLVFSRMSFSGDATPKTIGLKIKVKKVDKVRFRLENSREEPFGIFEVAMEYAENGKYKR